MRFGGMAMNKDSINAEMRLNKAEYDPQKFLIVADSFFYAAEVCSNSWKLEEETFPKVQIAIFTSRAFACEIYIKAILYHCHVPIPNKGSNGKEFNRHSLASLFSLLSDEIKETVYSHYHELSESGFFDRILLIANTFEEMRYAYEYRSLKTEIVFLESFTKYLKETAHNIIDTNQQTIPSSPAPDDQNP